MSHITRRIGQSVLTVLAVITISFFLIRLMPGGPVDALIARLVSQGYNTEQINSIIQTYLEVDPQQPLLQAYMEYMIAVLQGEFGRSITQNEAVIDILARALPWTLFYASVSLLISFSTGVILGAYMAYKEGSPFDIGASIFLIIVNSTPYYVFAVIALAILGYQLQWFPTGGKMPTDVQPGLTFEFLFGALHHAALPIATSVFMGFGGFALSMRGNSISVLGEDYLRVGRLRGLTTNRLALRYVGRNAVLPLYTRLMLALGGVFGGSVILEQVFRYPGVGYYMFNAVKARDMPLMMGGFMVIAIAIVVGILIADLTYSRIDPRAARVSSSEGDADASLIQAGRRTYRRVLYRLRSDESGVPRRREDGDADTDSVLGQHDHAESVSRSVRYRQLFDEYVRAPTKIVWSDWRSVTGVSILIIFVALGMIVWVSVSEWGPLARIVIVDKSSTLIGAGPAFVPPFETMVHPLGTDAAGRDLLALIVYATPAMLKMLLAGAVFATILGTIIGTVSGYLKGTAVDRILMTASDIAMTIPGLPLIMVLAVTIEPGNPYFVGLLLTITSWAGLARTLRSEVLTIREAEYVEASQMMGLSTRSTVLRDILPNLMPFVLVSFVEAGRRVIFGSVGLYFLGILPFSNLNWGVIINQAYTNGALISFSLLYWLLIPMATVTLLSLGLILVAQGMDRLFNPRIRARHMKHAKDEGGGEEVSSPSTAQPND